MEWLMIVLAAIFVMAKLMNVIAWSWWLVLLPVWIYVGFMALVFLITFVVVVLKEEK